MSDKNWDLAHAALIGQEIKRKKLFRIPDVELFQIYAVSSTIAYMLFPKALWKFAINLSFAGERWLYVLVTQRSEASPVN